MSMVSKNMEYSVMVYHIKSRQNILKFVGFGQKVRKYNDVWIILQSALFFS